MRCIIKEYTLGDMIARYETDESQAVGLFLCPAGMKNTGYAEKQSKVDSLVQVKLVGDTYNGAYAQGQTLRECSTVKRLRYVDQKYSRSCDGRIHLIKTTLQDDRGIEAEHFLRWMEGTNYVRCRTTLRNRTDEPVRLELLSSFSIQNISPWLPEDCHDRIWVHRIRGRWSEEGRLESQSMEELQLETSWTREAVRCERFGSIGSMPVNRYFPFLALEDQENHVFWGAQLEIPSSWQMEIYRIDDNIAIDGGISDREFGHWMKELKPGEAFDAPEAILTVCQTKCLEVMTNRLTQAGMEAMETWPESERHLPIIFNEYCTTWGNPSHENIMEILAAIRGKGFEYFVIDCGWYKEDGVPWDIGMGDYEVSKTLFPEGLEKTVEAIREAGMKPGIWFEIEAVGPASKAYGREEHLLLRDGAVLTTSRRRFWNLSDPWVQDYLDEKVIGTLKKYGFEYMKVDYNDEIGIGVDGGESLGEALRINMEETYHYFEKAVREVQGLVLENCASGGHRLEPGFMRRCSMASFSDAHECVEIPIIAANLHRVILPRQSQIWAVIRETDSLKRIAYSVINTFLGRMCISGDVQGLTKEQWSVLEKGMEFYREIAPVIGDGQSYIFGTPVKSMRHPEGWQAVLRIGQCGAYMTIHVFGGKLPKEISVELPVKGTVTVRQVYSDTPEEIRVEDGRLYYTPKENWKAVAANLLLAKEA